MNARISLIAAALLVFAANSPAQQKKDADVKAKPVITPAAAAKVTAPPASPKTTAQPQQQSARAKTKKSGGQTEDDLYVGVK